MTQPTCDTHCWHLSKSLFDAPGVSNMVECCVCLKARHLPARVTLLGSRGCPRQARAVQVEWPAEEVEA